MNKADQVLPRSLPHRPPLMDVIARNAVSLQAKIIATVTLLAVIICFSTIRAKNEDLLVFQGASSSPISSTAIWLPFSSLHTSVALRVSIVAALPILLQALLHLNESTPHLVAVAISVGSSALSRIFGGNFLDGRGSVNTTGRRSSFDISGTGAASISLDELHWLLRVSLGIIFVVSSAVICSLISFYNDRIEYADDAGSIAAASNELIQAFFSIITFEAFASANIVLAFVSYREHQILKSFWRCAVASITLTAGALCGLSSILGYALNNGTTAGAPSTTTTASSAGYACLVLLCLTVLILSELFIQIVVTTKLEIKATTSGGGHAGSTGTRTYEPNPAVDDVVVGYVGTVLFTMIGVGVAYFSVYGSNPPQLSNGGGDEGGAATSLIAALFYIQTAASLVLGTIPYHEIHVKAKNACRLLGEKKTFLQYISHEIRTPLNTVTVGISCIQDDLRKITGQIKRNATITDGGGKGNHREIISTIKTLKEETVKDIEVSCQSALAILSELLMSDKMESGKLQLEIEYCPPKTFFLEAVRPFMVQAKKKSISFVMEFGGMRILETEEAASYDKQVCKESTSGSPSSCERALATTRPAATDKILNKFSLGIDQNKVTQVVRNLISNALKFTPEDGAIRIVISRIPRTKMGKLVGIGGPASSKQPLSTITKPVTMRTPMQTSPRSQKAAPVSGNNKGELQLRLLPSFRQVVGGLEKVTPTSDGRAVDHFQRIASLLTSDANGGLFVSTTRRVVPEDVAAQQPAQPFLGQEVEQGEGKEREEEVEGVRNTKNKEEQGGEGNHPQEEGSRQKRHTAANQEHHHHIHQDRRTGFDAPATDQNEVEAEGAPAQEDAENDGEHQLLRVEVIDSGAGISPANQLNLFKKYTQFDAAKLQKGGGTGLGLWISKGIVEMHGGVIGAYSAGEGQGTTFFFELPLLPVSVDSFGNIDPRRSASISGKMSELGSVSSGGQWSGGGNKLGSSFLVNQAASPIGGDYLLSQFIDLQRDEASFKDCAHHVFDSRSIRAIGSVRSRVSMADFNTIRSTGSGPTTKSIRRIMSMRGSAIMLSKFMPAGGVSTVSDDAAAAGGVEETRMASGTSGVANKLKRMISGSGSGAGAASPKNITSGAAAALRAPSSDVAIEDLPMGLSLSPQAALRTPPSQRCISSPSPMIKQFSSSVSAGMRTSKTARLAVVPEMLPPPTVSSTNENSVAVFGDPRDWNHHHHYRGESTTTSASNLRSSEHKSSFDYQQRGGEGPDSRTVNTAAGSRRESADDQGPAPYTAGSTSGSSVRDHQGAVHLQTPNLNSWQPGDNMGGLSDGARRAPSVSPAYALASNEPPPHDKNDPTSSSSSAGVGAGAGGVVSIANTSSSPLKHLKTPSSSSHHHPHGDRRGSQVAAVKTPSGNNKNKKNHLRVVDSEDSLEGDENDIDEPAATCSAKKLPTILIVDDAASNRKMVARLLRDMASEILEAEDGKDCLRVVQEAADRRKPVDIILMDDNMPNLSGPETARILRFQGYNGLICGVTGNTLPSDIKRFKDHGASCVLSKPLNVELLKYHINQNQHRQPHS